MFGEVPLEDKVKFLSYLCELRGSQSNTTPKNIKFIEVSLFPYLEIFITENWVNLDSFFFKRKFRFCPLYIKVTMEVFVLFFFFFFYTCIGIFIKKNSLFKTVR